MSRITSREQKYFQIYAGIETIEHAQEREREGEREEERGREREEAGQKEEGEGK